MKMIAVLLTVFNRKQKTIECLRKLYKQIPIRGYKIDVYLTDDGSTDGTSKAVKDEFPMVKILNGDGTLFWNRGMYKAWQEAAKKNYDFYLWLNDDTYVYSNLFETLLSASEAKDNKSIIVGATQSAITKKSTYGGHLPNGKIPDLNGNLIKIHHFNGNIVLVPKFVYNKLGNLDYHYSHSKGDFDYGLRANKEDIEMYQVGKYLGICEAHESLDKWCNPEIPFLERWKMLYRPNGMPPNEMFYFENKHYSLFSAVFHYFTIHLRCIFPYLWIKKNIKQ